MNKFLEQNQYLYDRLKAGIDIHPPDADVAEFQALAKVIDPHKSFQSTGCISCVNNLVKFVYDKQKTLESKLAEAEKLAEASKQPEQTPAFIQHETFPAHGKDRTTESD